MSEKPVIDAPVTLFKSQPAANDGVKVLYLCQPRDRANFHAVSVVFEHYAQLEQKQECQRMLHLCNNMARGDDVSVAAAPSAVWKCDVVRDKAFWGPALQFGMIVTVCQYADRTAVALEVLQLGISRATRQPVANVFEIETDTDHLAVQAGQKQKNAPFRAIAQRALNLADMLTRWPARQQAQP